MPPVLHFTSVFPSYSSFVHPSKIQGSDPHEVKAGDIGVSCFLEAGTAVITELCVEHVLVLHNYRTVNSHWEFPFLVSIQRQVSFTWLWSSWGHLWIVTLCSSFLSVFLSLLVALHQTPLLGCPGSGHRMRKICPLFSSMRWHKARDALVLAEQNV